MLKMPDPLTLSLAPASGGEGIYFQVLMNNMLENRTHD
jgi:hypothetical protein